MSEIAFLGIEIVGKSSFDAVRNVKWLKSLAWTKNGLILEPREISSSFELSGKSAVRVLFERLLKWGSQSGFEEINSDKPF